MFVGYYLDSKSIGTDINVAPVHNLEFLETTMIGNAEKPGNKPFKDQRSVESSESYMQFIAAVREGDRKFQSDVWPNWRNGNPQYRVISIRNIREKGINPIPR